MVGTASLQSVQSMTTCRYLQQLPIRLRFKWNTRGNVHRWIGRSASLQCATRSGQSTRTMRLQHTLLLTQEFCCISASWKQSVQHTVTLTVCTRNIGTERATSCSVDLSLNFKKLR